MYYQCQVFGYHESQICMFYKTGTPTVFLTCLLVTFQTSYSLRNHESLNVFFPYMDKSISLLIITSTGFYARRIKRF